MLDIGAGTGALTAPLAATGARVVAIELHPDRLAALRRRFDVDSTNPRERFDVDSTNPRERFGADSADRRANAARRFDVESTPRGSGAGAGTVTVVRADATDLRLPRRPFVVVANPPWSAITALLRRLTHPSSRLERAHLVVPHHVAARWASFEAPGAHRWRRTFDVSIGDRVPRSAFRPAPPQPATLLVVRRRSG